MSEPRILAQLAPPAGGWQRLVARRDAARSRQRLGVPMAMAVALAIVVIGTRPEPVEFEVPWTGGRLVAQPGAGTLRVTNADPTPLPAEYPGVRLYWLQEKQ